MPLPSSSRTASRNTGARWSHDGQWLAYESTRRNGKDADIYLVDPSDPKSTRCLLTNSSTGWTVADWSQDDARLLLRHGRSETRAELWTVDVKSGEKKRLTPAGEDLIYDHPRFGDGDTAIYATTNDGSDFLMLERIDLATGKREPLSGRLPWDVEGFEISGDGKTLAFVTDEDGFSRLHLLDLATRRELPVPESPGRPHSAISRGIRCGMNWAFRSMVPKRRTTPTLTIWTAVSSPGGRTGIASPPLMSISPSRNSSA